ncbi:hypothetical protein A0J51_02987 [Gluconobacter japonicus]|nr:hypothetical protein A0J51_02987 [Gluconobacter japonicus]
MLLVDQGFKLSAPAREKSRHRVIPFHFSVRGRATDSDGKRYHHAAMVIPLHTLCGEALQSGLALFLRLVV